MDQGDAAGAYSCASIDSGIHDWKTVPMDIGYGINPALMKSGCDEELEQSIKSDELVVLDNKLIEAYRFIDRYGVNLNNYERARQTSENKHKVKSRSTSSGSGSSTHKNPSASRSRRNTGSSTIDPDDHDIEAYYQDNIDEYDDYDDAYEGFLDDDSAWDDY